VWSITPIVGSTLASKPTIPKGDSVWFRYTGLPDSNNQFGVKYLKASLVDYDVAESVMVKVFFPKYATNNPSDTLPNWYYYWRQTPAGLDSNIYSGPKCIASWCGYYDFSDYFYHVCPAAAETDSARCDSTSVAHIDLFAMTCRHERQHQTDYDTWWRPIGGYGQNRHLDADSDFVPSSIEPSLGLDSLNKFSNPWGADSVSDFEYRGYNSECIWLRGSADQYDWSNPGRQF